MRKLGEVDGVPVFVEDNSPHVLSEALISQIRDEMRDAYQKPVEVFVGRFNMALRYPEGAVQSMVRVDE